MRTFTDNVQREWAIEVNVNALKRLKPIGVDLAGDGFSTVIQQLASDPIMLVDTLFVLCQSQADKMGISDMQFGQSMAGDAIERATNALVEALIDFFPKARQRALRTVWEKVKTADTQMIDYVGTIVDEGKLDQAIKAEFEQRKREIEEALEGRQSLISGNGFMKPQESSESTPDHSASEN